ncbi:serine hydrolase domain-containing protein [Nocardioides bizhenqiangii]|uniref:Serine hydrolase domain-containing protein n=1 Tax=Nocardioides bizhenqiangii TaxID=3095076 RepID=A0ABZ0ZMY8_9ACTN|nr:serine hydrolase domain-containing protein [Nocardioides sp. HM61]WQQ25126.1 serine hydrolase domain-containing protein [Nocardioides sp. HM61]
MHPRLRWAAATVVASVLLSSCESDQPPPEKQPERADVLRASDVPDGSSGSLVAVADGEVVTCRGWGESDHESATPAGCDTVYDIGSVSKQFTAAAVVKLQMQGRLRVIDTLGDYFAGVPKDKRGITVRHLLTHTAGLIDALGDDYDPLTRRAMITGALASELRTQPGTRYHYSNLGYSLLAAIVEEASGTGYEEYLVKELFEPAGMTHTGYVLPDWDAADVAVEYDDEDRSQGRPFEHPWAADGPYWNLRGNGGILSTADDMGRWLLALEGERVLDEGAKAELFRPRVLEEPGGDTRYAFGWVVAETPFGTVDWHNGGNGWSYAELARLPGSRAGLFWVTNHYRSAAGGWNFDRLRPSLTERVAKRLVGGR